MLPPVHVGVAIVQVPPLPLTAKPPLPAAVPVLFNRMPLDAPFDETQETARSYQAECTPDFFLFDASRKLAYRGRLDESTPGNGKPLTGADLRTALDAVLAGEPAPRPQMPSLGCSIKWK